MNNLPSIPDLERLVFDNAFLRDFPGDVELKNFPRQVRDACYSKVAPTPASKPLLVAYSLEVAQLLGMSETFCQSDPFTQIFSGNRLLPGMEPHATCYGGHQFGVWAGQLGDGRVINLGDIINSQNERWTIQLKGAGLTPYSRHADGLAVLRSSIREFLASEAMYHLGIPTTRALSVINTGDQVVRDMFYNGNPKHEPGAVVCRVAPSFLRFGHFQILAAQGRSDLVRQLADFTIQHFFNHLGNSSKDTYLLWFSDVCRRTAEMLAYWQCQGFVHGVMNTDNMSILGLTIDYGPFGWLESYDPDWTPNTTDAAERRYRFSNQPNCGFWNLAQLANAIFTLNPDIRLWQDALQDGYKHFLATYQNLMTEKLGMKEFDKTLVEELFTILELVETDMSIFFRRLAELPIGADFTLIADQAIQVMSLLQDAYYTPGQIDDSYQKRLWDWLIAYQACLERTKITYHERRLRMININPNYVLRNYLLQIAIDKAEHGDFTEVRTLLKIFRRPYSDDPIYANYSLRRPEWARHRAGCSMLSCSS